MIMKYDSWEMRSPSETWRRQAQLGLICAQWRQVLSVTAHHKDGHLGLK